MGERQLRALSKDSYRAARRVQRLVSSCSTVVAAFLPYSPECVEGRLAEKYSSVVGPSRAGSLMGLQAPFMGSALEQPRDQALESSLHAPLVRIHWYFIARCQSKRCPAADP